MGRDRAASVRAWRTYAGERLRTRAFLGARLAFFPFGQLDPELRSLRGRVLSLGCGHGAVERYLAEINDGVEVDGLELDAGRVAVAQRTAGDAPRVRVRTADVTELSGGDRYDAALVFDVLHHVPAARHAAIAASLADRLRPGGRVLIKDVDVRPRWKYHWNRLHDRLVARQPVYCRDPEAMAAVFAGAGLAASGWRRIERPGSPYPRYLLELRKPEVTGAA